MRGGGTMSCEHCSNHQMPLSLYKVPTYSTRAGAAPRTPGGARHGGGNRAVTSQPRTGQSTSYGDVKSSYGGGRRVGQEGVRDRLCHGRPGIAPLRPEGGALPPRLSPALGSGKASPLVLETVPDTAGLLGVQMTPRQRTTLRGT